MGIVFPFPRASNFVVGCISLFWFWSNFSRYIIGIDRWLGGWMVGWLDGWMDGWMDDGGLVVVCRVVFFCGCCLLLEATGS